MYRLYNCSRSQPIVLTQSYLQYCSSTDISGYLDTASCILNLLPYLSNKTWGRKIDLKKTYDILLFVLHVPVNAQKLKQLKIYDRYEHDLRNISNGCVRKLGTHGNY